MHVSLTELADLIGTGLALELCARWGGVRHYIPQHPQADHAFLAFLGPERFARLMREFGGQRIILPRGPHATKRYLAEQLIAAGCSNNVVAARCGCTLRYVEQVRSAMRGAAEASELPLFGKGSG